jgi:hypothetical protein
LIRIYQLQQLYFAPSKPERIAEIEGEAKDDLIHHLTRLSYLSSETPSNEEIFKALTAYIHTENFEMREQSSGFIDLEVLEYMKKS